MTTEHPISPPSLAIIKKWIVTNGLTISIAEASAIASLASRLGADQDLEACCEWLNYEDRGFWGCKLRAHRRPKPPSLKEQALLQLDTLNADLAMHGMGCDLSQIRRALEQLDD